MANNIATSITADAADLRVKRAIMQTDAGARRKAMRDHAKRSAENQGANVVNCDQHAAAALMRDPLCG
jgi:ABC-type branched-subunit amino acid transport system substrate-binding protein